MSSILECSSAGDKRFSALFAKVTLFGEEQTIEEWYQYSKRFGIKDVKNYHWKQIKGMSKWLKISHIRINGYKYDAKYLHTWYKTLWLIYLNKNPELVEYLKQFDEYNDRFKEKGHICQADVIRQYMRNRKSLVLECITFASIIGVEIN